MSTKADQKPIRADQSRSEPINRVLSAHPCPRQVGVANLLPKPVTLLIHVSTEGLGADLAPRFLEAGTDSIYDTTSKQGCGTRTCPWMDSNSGG